MRLRGTEHEMGEPRRVRQGGMREEPRDACKRGPRHENGASEVSGTRRESRGGFARARQKRCRKSPCKRGSRHEIAAGER